MRKELVEECIENVIARIENPKHKLSPYTYLEYFSKKHDFSFDEDNFARAEISKYIDNNASSLFEVSFTINGLAY